MSRGLGDVYKRQVNKLVYVISTCQAGLLGLSQIYFLENFGHLNRVMRGGSRSTFE